MCVEVIDIVFLLQNLILVRDTCHMIKLILTLTINNQVKPDIPTCTTVAPANFYEPHMIPPVMSAPPLQRPSVASNPTRTDDNDSGNSNISSPSQLHYI